MFDMNSTTTTDTLSQGPKFSRYRSVRRAAAIPEDVPALPEATQSQLNRAPSRYRSNRQRTHTIPIPAQPVPNLAYGQIQPQWSPVQISKTIVNATTPVKTAPLPAATPDQLQPNGDHEFDGGPVQKERSAGTITPVRERQLSRTISNTNQSPTCASPRSYEAAREEARMILEGEYDRIQKMKEMTKNYDVKPEQAAPDLRRTPTHVQKSQVIPQPVYIDAPKLNVKMRIEKSLPEEYHDAPRSIGQKAQSSEQPSRSKSNKISDTRPQDRSRSHVMVDAPVSSSQRQVEVAKTEQSRFDAPKYDAPRSAVNAGERRVEIRFNHADRGITLPVTPTTNSRDLLNSASIVMSEHFNPKTSILVESFVKLGLERPLRRYEHIRDVLNSWDSDDQNYLTIMLESDCQATGLGLSEAPENVVGRTMLQMYLSLRPGKWDKRWVILRPDGQVTMSKYENDGDATNICHLSDFDVYTPSPKQRKKLKPPKKLCFAVKSQQKSAMFLEGINFVHFFATSDKRIADQWYTAVQSWRSWYLVHVLGEGIQTWKETNAGVGVAGNARARPDIRQSTESVPYQLGSFRPLLDFSDLRFSASFDTPAADARPRENSLPKKPSIDLGLGRPSVDVGVNEATRRGSRQRGLPPPSSFPTKLFSEVDGKGRPSVDSGDHGFTGSGLLARSTSTRRSQGGNASGQGVTGPAGRPLVDLTPASEFAEGSLLRKLEAWSATQGDNELKIDRQKRVEAVVRVGERL